MARRYIDTLRKMRAKMVDQRRNMASRLAATAHTESYDHMVSLQTAIEATDRAIADEENILAMGANAQTSDSGGA
jgi:hypothetical protein